MDIPIKFKVTHVKYNIHVMYKKKNEKAKSTWIKSEYMKMNKKMIIFKSGVLIKMTRA